MKTEEPKQRKNKEAREAHLEFIVECWERRLKSRETEMAAWKGMALRKIEEAKAALALL